MGGGQIDTPDNNLSLDIPPGSLEGDTTVSVTKAVTNPEDPPADVTLVGGTGLDEVVSEYEFEPDGTTIDPPGNLTILADVTSISA